MPRSVVIGTLLLLVLAGCTTQPPKVIDVADYAPTCNCTQLESWLELQRKVSAMSIEKVEKRLAKLSEPKGNRQLFYAGLLNQQLDVFENWAQARDIFRQLAANGELTKEQRNLAAILGRYNQSRINWYLQHRQALEEIHGLKAKLLVSQEENELLEAKIQAVTDVETSISTRKEQ